MKIELKTNKPKFNFDGLAKRSFENWPKHFRQIIVKLNIHANVDSKGQEIWLQTKQHGGAIQDKNDYT
jgi:hypothetical protein